MFVAAAAGAACGFVLVDVVCCDTAGVNREAAGGLGVFELKSEFLNEGAALTVAGASGSVSVGCGVLEPNIENEAVGLAVAGASGSV